MTARHARTDERLRVIALLRDFHAAGNFGFPYDAARADRLARLAIADDNMACIVVGAPANGVLIGRAALSEMGPFRFAEELLIWIDPSARGTAWRDLLDAFEAWAREKGCQSIKVSVQQHWRGEALGRLWRRRGYLPVETVFSRPI
jgi:GNAT superfamily N-acetyltransferase